ncbi:activator of HSP90 ATPase [Actinoplanes sp. TBRC 11911]|uniref:activator of HSP90 ATPase n=1 Tax=Actinoplanes sp. TBRC 11911 TaxID=2729386 RepID=UPI00145EAC7E|nr:activator of HSP90 ATPase [Actinoplanes sp. TBRC 11911]NMO50866.1 activator of HSP90 ATPase [Actinoplanes sp. TBRC 11911]
MTDQRGLKPYEVEVSVDAGRDEVWESVTQPAVLHQWFGWDYDGLDAEIQQIFVSEATLWAPERMGWADGSFLQVDGDDDSARVRVAREGFGEAGPDDYDAIEEGWRAFLIQLRFLLSRRPQGRRRTLYLTGQTTGRQALALVDAEWQRDGARVAWAVTGDGHLVVAAGRVPLDEHEAAHVEITVSTYGLDDAAFETQREEWTKRWAPVAAYARVTAAGDPSPGAA